MVRPSFFVAALLVLSLAGCGGDGGGGSKTKSVTISAVGDTILPGGTLSLTAIVRGGGKVVWSVDGGSANGTVTSTGVYTAPSTQGTYVVRATAGGVSATKTIEVFNGISLALTANATPPLTIPRSKLTFAASVTGSTDKTVTWTTTGGTVGADGTFTAPDAPGSYTVTGTSHADPTKTASATVQVVANVNVRMKWTDYDGTAKGDVLLSLRPTLVPNTVANFVTLVNKGFYDGVRVHRYVPGFVVQWGSPTSKTADLATLQDNMSSIGTSSEGPLIPFEPTGLPFEKYVLGMASTSPQGPTQSQMFVTLDPAPHLDPDYVAFGAIASGDAVIDALQGGDTIASARAEALAP